MSIPVRGVHFYRAMAVALFVCLCALVPQRVGAMGALYSDTVFTSRSVSRGYHVEGTLYFLASYGLYRAPKGIARFPDGGRARYLFHETYLYRLDPATENLEQLMVVWSERMPGLNVRYSYFEYDAPVLEAVFASGHGSRESPEAWHAVGWDTRSDVPVQVGAAGKRALLDRFTYEAEGRWSLRDTLDALKPVTLAEWGVPSPLEYTRRSDREYVEDLVALRADQPYRDAIIEAIADGRIPGEAEDILQRIDEHRRALSEPGRGFYELMAADTVAGLEALRERAGEQ